MPYWSPGDELRHPAEALTLSHVSVPRSPQREPILRRGTQGKIFAHLLIYRPTPEQMAWWMCMRKRSSLRVKGTQYAAMIDKKAPAQRSGILASLNMVADSLKLLPSETKRMELERGGMVEARKGWVFLTSTPKPRERLLPLTSFVASIR